MILFKSKKCISICLKNTNSYVRLAVEDMKNDFKRVSESCVCPEIIEQENDYCIVIEENKGNVVDPIENESFAIKSEGNVIRISADGYLGTMWGIYTFCEKYLGVEPCYLFDDLETEKHKILEISDIDIKEKPNGFRFRGVFVNDEDLLSGWKDGGGIRYLDFPWYGLTVDEKVIAMVVETVLRLKLNLVIPASFLDIDNPFEKLLADQVAKRGIYVSQHHLEPLGLSAFTYRNYCKKYNKNGEFSYLSNSEGMEEAWEFYAKKWAQYDNVVWQIGLRGEGDRPVWQEKDPTDEELKMYGEFINKAYEKQKEIVLKVTNNKAKHFTSTLWMEGAKLAEKGFLRFPKDTIAVLADTGLNQTYGDEYYNLKRDENMKYGIYNHIQYYSSGPHLAPQTGLDKLYFNINVAYEKGDNEYLIMNISNTREFVFEIKAYSQIVWETKGFSKEKYLEDYCKTFGKFSEEVKDLVKRYYGNLPWMEAKYLAKHPHIKYFNFYTKDDLEGIRNFIIKEGDLMRDCGGDIILNFHRELKIEIHEIYREKLKIAIPEYEKLYRDIEKLSEKLSDRLKKHIQVKWLLFTKTLITFYKWYVNMYEAKLYCDLYDTEKMKASLETAAVTLEDYLRYRKCAEYGIFKNWYRGDLKMDVKQKLMETRRFLGQNPEF